MIDYLALMNQWGISPWFLCILTISIIWSAIWKGIALWKSARKGSVVWFVILFLVNTLGILEILYIFVFSEMKCCKDVSRQRRRKR